MCFIDLDPCEVWEETERKARKTHTCSSCERIVQKGERYWVHFSVFEDQITTGKMCQQCFADRKVFASAHDGTLMGPAYFPDMLRECIAEGDEESENRWKPMLEAIKARGKSS